MGKFKYNIKETKKPKDVDPALIARLDTTYGPVKDTDFFKEILHYMSPMDLKELQVASKRIG